jgi:hypothetical protein
MTADNHLMYKSPFGHVTHEYLLPATALSDDDRKDLPAWFAEIVEVMAKYKCDRVEN